MVAELEKLTEDYFKLVAEPGYVDPDPQTGLPMIDYTTILQNPDIPIKTKKEIADLLDLKDQSAKAVIYRKWIQNSDGKATTGTIERYAYVRARTSRQAKPDERIKALKSALSQLHEYEIAHNDAAPEKTFDLGDNLSEEYFISAAQEGGIDFHQYSGLPILNYLSILQHPTMPIEDRREISDILGIYHDSLRTIISVNKWILNDDGFATTGTLEMLAYVRAIRTKKVELKQRVETLKLILSNLRDYENSYDPPAPELNRDEKLSDYFPLNPELKVPNQHIPKLIGRDIGIGKLGTTTMEDLVKHIKGITFDENQLSLWLRKVMMLDMAHTMDGHELMEDAEISGGRQISIAIHSYQERISDLRQDYAHLIRKEGSSDGNQLKARVSDLIYMVIDVYQKSNRNPKQKEMALDGLKALYNHNPSLYSEFSLFDFDDVLEYKFKPRAKRTPRPAEYTRNPPARRPRSSNRRTSIVPDDIAWQGPSDNVPKIGIDKPVYVDDPSMIDYVERQLPEDTLAVQLALQISRTPIPWVTVGNISSLGLSMNTGIVNEALDRLVEIGVASLDEKNQLYDKGSYFKSPIKK